MRNIFQDNWEENSKIKLTTSNNFSLIGIMLFQRDKPNAIIRPLKSVVETFVFKEHVLDIIAIFSKVDPL